MTQIRATDDPAQALRLIGQRTLGDTAARDAAEALIWASVFLTLWRWRGRRVVITLRQAVAAIMLGIIGMLAFGGSVALLDRRKVILQNTLLACAGGLDTDVETRREFRKDVALGRDWQKKWCWWVPR